MSAPRSHDIRLFLLDLVAQLGPDLLLASRHGGATTTKSSFHDVVTVHDQATEKAIRDAVFAAFPESIVLGEETGWSTAEGRPAGTDGHELQWIVDPIDGTSNFAAGWDHWCISIASVYRGELYASAIHQPLTGRTWSADEDGSYLDEPGCETRTLRVDSAAEPRHGLCTSEYPSVRASQGWDDPLGGWRVAASQFRSMRRTGSTALDLCFVADGRALASFSTGTHSWDVAAGIHILERAGALYEAYGDDGEAHPLWDGPTYIAAASAPCRDVCREALGL
ncbi:inositol monophosphatase family protein [Flaviflexus equikiangi]|uniref:Inositol monophosphatase n=1 Tax=Flaviflexus equikiangi TaxID=2758573 RepID=A0ABS2TGT1_9ACTO|nr:inositol monophosphatase [Flaviflexus equikiangi]MBM9433854.1 inositol monophosphatase [Flaviflexus equikiangi]